MTTLPKEFEEYTRGLFGEETFARFLSSFDEKQPLSVRLNPFKPGKAFEGQQVPWCRNAVWLDEKPDFTLDPLFHAGCYYVQEAASMFLDEVLRQQVTRPVTMLDLCAAPGGKSTLARAALPEGSLLFCNEPDHKRANILMENIQKQGHKEVIVTNNYAKDYRKAKLKFDVILTDVPCSGEGMFRKDENTIGEWSIKNVINCHNLQRSIIEDIWPCLNDGGLLIYSTCTFNTSENEENVKWIAETLGAEFVNIDTKEDWHISGSKLEGFDKPVYRFIPGTTKTEGLFMAVLRKDGQADAGKQKISIPNLQKSLRIMHDGNPQPTIKGKDKIPAHAEALMTDLDSSKYPMTELSLDQALNYLRRETITLDAGIPKGYVIVCYKGIPLGFVKNLGNRANNLYPQEWRIRKSINR